MIGFDPGWRLGLFDGHGFKARTTAGVGRCDPSERRCWCCCSAGEKKAGWLAAVSVVSTGCHGMLRQQDHEQHVPSVLCSTVLS